MHGPARLYQARLSNLTSLVNMVQHTRGRLIHHASGALQVQTDGSEALRETIMQLPSHSIAFLDHRSDPFVRKPVRFVRDAHLRRYRLEEFPFGHCVRLVRFLWTENEHSAQPDGAG